jgi:hypothetical protein
MMLAERDHVLDCLQRAKTCADGAARTASNYEATWLLDLERKWVKLALSYMIDADIRIVGKCRDGPCLMAHDARPFQFEKTQIPLVAERRFPPPWSIEDIGARPS